MGAIIQKTFDLVGVGIPLYRFSLSDYQRRRLLLGLRPASLSHVTIQNHQLELPGISQY